MRIILLGAPGAGKGTQAKNISGKLEATHISTGDILRNELKENTSLGKKAAGYMQAGELVPDDLIIEIIRQKLQKKGVSDNFLMDGFPRTINQAKKFDDMLDSLGIKIDRVINLDVNQEELLKRLTSRRICRACNYIFAASLEDPENTSCPKCGGELYRRKDDEAAVIAERLKVYEKETRPLIDYYQKKGLLVSVNGKGSEKEITERLHQVL